MELAVKWMFAVDKELELPYQDNLVSLMGDETFRDIVGAPLLQRMEYIRKLGNTAAHSEKKISKDQAALALENLWYFLDFVAYCYAEDYESGSFDRGLLEERIAAAPAEPRNDNEGETPHPSLAATPSPQGEGISPHPSASQTPAPHGEGSGGDMAVGTSSACPRTSDARPYIQEKNGVSGEQLAALLAENAALREELTARRAEQQQSYVPKPLELSEFKTRKLYIDVMLQDAGWIEGKNWLNEVELPGMPNASEVGYADYVLYGDDGRPLAVVEAKRTCVDVSKGRQQAKLYADLLEQKYHRRPVIFLTNGFETRITDNLYPERKCAAIWSKRDLEKLFNLQSMRTSLAHVMVNRSIAGRYYQENAIKAVCEAFDKKNRRKVLLVMATGSGKTRTVIDLCDVLLQHAGSLRDEPLRGEGQLRRPLRLLHLPDHVQRHRCGDGQGGQALHMWSLRPGDLRRGPPFHLQQVP